MGIGGFVTWSAGRAEKRSDDPPPDGLNGPNGPNGFEGSNGLEGPNGPVEMVEASLTALHLVARAFASPHGGQMTKLLLDAGAGERSGATRVVMLRSTLIPRPPRVPHATLAHAPHATLMQLSFIHGATPTHPSRTYPPRTHRASTMHSLRIHHA